jgi:hypothetical protein
MEKTKKHWWSQLYTEDWIIVFAAAIILVLAILIPSVMPKMPKTLAESKSWLDAGYMFLFCWQYLPDFFRAAQAVKGVFLSFLTIFYSCPAFQCGCLHTCGERDRIGIGIFCVIFGLLISNLFGIPKWLKPAIQSEFYIKIGIITLGSTILF